MLEGFPEDLRICCLPGTLLGNMRTQWQEKGGDLSQLVDMSIEEINSMKDEELSKFTHILSNEMFEGFDRVSYSLYIPVVTDKWLESGFENGKVQPVKIFTPDERMIFKGGNFCLARFDSNDVIKVLINKFGGEVHSELKTSLCYYIKGDEGDTNLSIIKDFNTRGNNKIEIIDLGYILDKIDPKMKLKGIKVSIDKSIKSPVNEFIKNLLIKMEATVVKGKSADVVITMRQLENVQVQKTPDWIFDYALGLTKPSILHTPPRSTPALGIEGVIVATTNYTGDSRRYIELIVERMGGKFSKTLKKENTTHLIAANSIGDKWSYAKLWGVNIVNHCLLEDSFMQWKMLNCEGYENLVREKDSNVRIIDTCVVEGELKRHMDESEVEVIEEVLDLSTEIQPEPTPDAEPKKAKRSKSTPKHSQELKKATLNITAILTGVELTLSPKDKKLLKSKGITIIDNPLSSKLNCIISPTLLRTEKFLKAMSKNPKYYLYEDIVSDALKGDINGLEEYSLWDKIDFEDVKSRGIFQTESKEEAMELMTRSKHGMMNGWEFVCGNETMGSVVKLFGGKVVKRTKSATLSPIKWDKIVLSIFSGEFDGTEGVSYEICN